MTELFNNRRDAGKRLAKALAAYKKREDAIVLALPRGGVPVAWEVAKALRLPLDVMLVRKLGVPGEEELAMGALALPNVAVFNRDVIRNIPVRQDEIDAVIAREAQELQRRNKLYRCGTPPPDLKGRVVILVDDGVATGANMRAALGAVVKQRPAYIVAAVTVAPKLTLAMLETEANEVVCLSAPDPFHAVGQAYEDFSPVADEEVLSLLDEARRAA